MPEETTHHHLADDGERIRCSCGWASVAGAERHNDRHETTPCKSQSLGEEPGPNSPCKSGDGGQTQTTILEPEVVEALTKPWLITGRTRLVRRLVRDRLLTCFCGDYFRTGEGTELLRVHGVHDG